MSSRLLKKKNQEQKQRRTNTTIKERRVQLVETEILTSLEYRGSLHLQHNDVRELYTLVLKTLLRSYKDEKGPQPSESLNFFSFPFSYSHSPLFWVKWADSNPEGFLSPDSVKSGSITENKGGDSNVLCHRNDTRFLPGLILVTNLKLSEVYFLSWRKLLV